MQSAMSVVAVIGRDKDHFLVGSVRAAIESNALSKLSNEFPVVWS